MNWFHLRALTHLFCNQFCLTNLISLILSWQPPSLSYMYLINVIIPQIISPHHVPASLQHVFVNLRFVLTQTPCSSQCRRFFPSFWWHFKNRVKSRLIHLCSFFNCHSMNELDYLKTYTYTKNIQKGVPLHIKRFWSVECLKSCWTHLWNIKTCFVTFGIVDMTKEWGIHQGRYTCQKNTKNQL